MKNVWVRRVAWTLGALLVGAGLGLGCRSVPSMPPRARAQARFEKDAARFDQATRREIETLYRTYAKGLPNSEEALKTLIEKHPQANRTGCAVMYAAQRAKTGEERERLLKLAIEKFGDCYYGDGAQVAAYARWYLARTYAEAGKTEEANRLFDELRRDYSDAVTHRGRKLVEHLP